MVTSRGCILNEILLEKIKQSVDAQISAKHVPGWVREFKEDCFKKLTVSAYPTADQEVFKFSKIPELDLESLEVEFEQKNVGLQETEKLLASLGYSHLIDLIESSSAVVIVTDGLVSEIINKAGSAVLIQNSFDDLPKSITETRLSDEPKFYDALCGCLTKDLVYVSCDKNAEPTGCVTIVNLITASNCIVSPTVIIGTKENSSIKVVEIFVSQNNNSFVLPVTLLNLGKNSRTSYVRFQLLSYENLFSGLQLSNHESGAKLNTLQFSIGSSVCRMRIDSNLVGEGSVSELAAVSHGRYEQKLDLRTKQNHVGTRTESNMISATVLGGSAQSVTTGLVKMQNGSKKSTAVQSNKNLLVTSTAHAESIPNLDILENDVRCDHASSIGPINLEQLNFLESRGIEPTLAKKLIIKGFLNSVMDTVRPNALPVQAITAAKSIIRELPD